MQETPYIVEALGGPKLFGQQEVGVEALRDQIRHGLPYSSLETVMTRFGLGREEVSVALDLPLRTLTRRKRERRLRPDESDRLFRLARIASQAVVTLGSEDKASQWLHRANRALGGDAPLEILDTDIGARLVEEVLGRIEQGVYS